MREIEATHVVEGQDGQVAWGRSGSAVADTKEPFAWAIGADRMEKCYIHNGLSPSRSIVAGCYVMSRVKR